MLEFIFRKISNQFFSEASLELSLPQNAVANYDLFLAGVADNPFVLSTTHTLVEHSLFSSHTNQMLQRSGKRLMWLPEAWLTWIRPHISSRQGCHGKWIQCLVLCESQDTRHTWKIYMRLHQYKLRAVNYKRLSSMSERIQEMLQITFFPWL